MPTTTAKRHTTPRAAQAAETRQRLVAAAVDLFSERSYDDVAAGDIAKAAGVAHGLLFHYFGSKRGIYLQAIREAVDQLDEAFSFESNLPPAQQLRRALHLESALPEPPPGTCASPGFGWTRSRPRSVGGIRSGPLARHRRHLGRARTRSRQPRVAHHRARGRRRNRRSHGVLAQQPATVSCARRWSTTWSNCWPAACARPPHSTPPSMSPSRSRACLIISRSAAASAPGRRCS